MQNYPPGSLVMVVLSEDGREMTEEVFHIREFYEGTRREWAKGHRLERWGSEAADARARELGIRCVQAFVPLPVPPQSSTAYLWGKILVLFRQLRSLIVNNPFEV